MAWILHLSRTGRLSDEFAVDLQVLRRLLQILYTICDSTSVYPHITPDGENGVSAVWYAERYALELFVDCDQDATAIVKVDGVLESINLDKGGSPALRAIRGHLGTVSAYVKSRNPHWRQLIAE